MKHFRYYFTLLFITLLSACGTETFSPNQTGSVIIVNEGNFTHGNASLSAYNPTTHAIQNDIYKTTNHFALGDVAQNLVMVGDTAFIVMNNSQKVVAADAANNFKFLYSISLPNASPRYFLPINQIHAYVSDLYANRIWIVNYRTGAIMDSISVHGWTERMYLYNGYAYVMQKSTPGGATAPALLRINTTTKQVTEYPLAAEPKDMDVSSNGKLYLLLQPSSTSSSSLLVFDMAGFAVSKVINFKSNRNPLLLKYSGYSDRIILYDNGIYSLPPSASIPPDTPILNTNSWNVYALGCDPLNGDIYISDAIDYQQASKIVRCSATGQIIHSFNAGIISNGFVFK